MLIAEIANVQLLETRNFHENAARKMRETDEIVNVTSASFLRIGGRFRKANVALGEFYDDTQDMISRVNNTVVSFGEWYLSKLYSLFEGVFKLDSWKGLIEKDLEAIEKRRDFLSEVMRWRTEQAMEIIIILLTLIDLIILVIGR